MKYDLPDQNSKGGPRFVNGLIEMPEELSRTREAYDHGAQAYHERFSTYGPYREQVLGFRKRLAAGSSVLDLGCGSGANARLLAEAGLEVKGYDFSVAMLEIARQQCPSGVFELADLRDLPETGTFGAVLASFCIVHLPDVAASAFLEKLPELMTAGALLHVSFMEGRSAALSSTTFSDRPLFYNYFDRNWIIETLAAVQLQLVSMASHVFQEQDGSTTTDVFLEFKKH